MTSIPAGTGSSTPSRSLSYAEATLNHTPHQNPSVAASSTFFKPNLDASGEALKQRPQPHTQYPQYPQNHAVAASSTFFKPNLDTSPLKQRPQPQTQYPPQPQQLALLLHTLFSLSSILGSTGHQPLRSAEPTGWVHSPLRPGFHAAGHQPLRSAGPTGWVHSPLRPGFHAKTSPLTPLWPRPAAVY
jgi:hypothetical protein